MEVFSKKYRNILILFPSSNPNVYEFAAENSKNILIGLLMNNSNIRIYGLFATHFWTFKATIEVKLRAALS